MKIQKKHMIIGAIVVSVMLLTGFGLVVADGPGRFWGDESHRGFHRGGFHHKFHGKGMADHILSRIDSRMAFLELNETQKEKVEEIKAKIKTRLNEGLEDRNALITELRAEMNEENPDVNNVSEIIKTRIRKMSSFMEENIDLFVEFYNILDDDQKAQMIERFREKMGPTEG
jgi:Spy/CpxP family protein refolding chaperone